MTASIRGATFSGRGHDAALVLHSAGWADGHIGDAFRVSCALVQKWRRHNGLASNAASSEGGKFRPKIDNAEALRMHGDGATDNEIAARFGTLPSGAFYWRKRHGLPANYEGPSRLTDAERRTIRKLLLSGLTKGQVAERVGRCTATVKVERRKLKGKTGLRRSGISASDLACRARNTPDLFDLVRRAIPRGHGESITLDAEQDMLTGLYAGELDVRDIKKRAPDFISAVYTRFADRYGDYSLEEERGEEGFTLGSTLVDEDSTHWMDGALERAWQGPLA